MEHQEFPNPDDSSSGEIPEEEQRRALEDGLKRRQETFEGETLAYAHRILETKSEDEIIGIISIIREVDLIDHNLGFLENKDQRTTLMQQANEMLTSIGLPAKYAV